MCFNEEQAAKLSPRFFNCSAPEPQPPALDVAPRVAAGASVAKGGQAAEVLAVGRDANAECEALKDETTCAATPPCVWCVSAAVPPACYTADEAKRLPPAVFQCHFPSAAA